MAIKLPDFMKFIREGGAKSRVIAVFGSLGIISLGIYLATRFLSGPGITGTTSHVASAPGTLQSVPGGKMSPEFYRAVSQANVQAAQQAQITGGSAVPTLLNIPGEQGAAREGDCTIICSDEAIDVTNDINDLVKSGKLSQEEANKLLALTKNNVTPEEFAENLNELVKQGKLTPEQARQLLERYKKQYQNGLLKDSAKIIDTLTKAGQLPVEVANQLLALQKNGISINDYADELNRLVKEGKISSETAAQLLAQYTKQKEQEQTNKAAFNLKQMAKSGQLTAEVALALEALQRKNSSVDEYAAELNRLVAAGKLTPEVAARLLAQYKKQHQDMGASAAINKLLDQEHAAALSEIDSLEKSGKISPETAALLREMHRKDGNPEQCPKTLALLVQQKKITPQEVDALLARCQKLSALKKQAVQLQEMQNRKASLDEYLDALRKAVKAGTITPQQATDLMQAYRTFIAAEAAGVPVPVAAVPGGEDFSKLQQRLQTTQAIPTGTVLGPGEFEQVTSAVNAEEADTKQQRIDQLMSAMSGQAQQLLAAWQPPTMQHKQGADDEKKPSGTMSRGAGEGKGEELTAENSKPAVKPLIKAGTILFAVLDTAINSDYPDTPVMATIVQGQYKGAKMLGKLNITAPGKDRIALSFTVMDMDDWIKGKPVTAFAIDPDTARTVLASDVDYHYLKRYGALFASSFMSGYASAVMSSGATTTTGIFGTSSTASKFSPGDKLAAGLGQVGTNLTAAVQSYVNTPPTVVINSGVGIGILFMGDVTK
jgi:polyhydroxyalkanoate synthesis regulator phasin